MNREAAVLIELFSPLPEDAASWREMFDTVCLPLLVSVPGVRAGRRGRGYRNPGPQAIADADPTDVCLLELESVDVVDSPEWRAAEVDCAAAAAGLRQLPESVYRAVLRQIFTTTDDYAPPPPAEAALLHGAFYEVPERHHEEFNDWYVTEHIPVQMTVPGYLNARRFRGLDDPERFVALYDVVSAANTTTAEAKSAMESAWSERIRSKLAAQRARRLFLVEALEMHTHAAERDASR